MGPEPETLRLIQATLPVIQAWASLKIEKINDKESRRRKKIFSEVSGSVPPSLCFFRRYIFPDGDCSGNETVLDRIALSLDSLFGGESPDDPNDTAMDIVTYPRLLALMETLQSADSTETTQTPPEKFLSFTSLEVWVAVKKRLDEAVLLTLSDPTTSTAKLPVRSSARSLREGQEELWQFHDCIFRALRCRCGGAKSNGTDRLACLGLEMWNGALPLKKRQIQIVVRDGTNQHRLLISLGSPTYVRGGNHSKPHACLCHHLSTNTTPNHLQQRLALHEDNLHEIEQVISEAPEGSSPISLHDLIALQQRFQGVPQFALALALASSLCYLYRGSWLWSPAHIRLYQTGRRVHLRTFLENQLLTMAEQDHSSQSRTSDIDCGYKDVQALGITLLEIHLGERLETYLGRKGISLPQSCSEDYLYQRALNVVKMEEQSFISGRYLNAIMACLKFSPQPGRGPEDENVRRTIFRQIVAPLEEELRGLHFFRSGTWKWTDRTVDEIAQHDAFAIEITQPPSDTTMPSQLAGELHSESPSRHDNSSFRPRQRTAGEIGSDDWVIRFQSLWGSPSGSRSETTPIKVAVLDSGISYHDPFFSKKMKNRIVEAMSFVDDPSLHDECGHGTSIAGILLKLSRNINLYIGKISKTERFNDPSAIAKGIKHAREDWKVDIISLSFEFEGDMRTTGSIAKEIKRCISSPNPIMVFAAAGNGGRGSKRSFPANLPDVFCIHAAHHDGTSSTLNPDAEDHRDNFLVLGCDIASPSNTASSSGTYVTGTSFAVPVAICIAAFMNTIINRIANDCEDWYDKPLSPSGMKVIFKAMVSEAKNRDYDLISPHQFIGCHKDDYQSVVDVMRKALNPY